MNSYYIFVRVKKALKSRLFTLEHTFSGLVSRENVKYDFFCKPLFAALRKSSGGNNDEGSHTQWDLYNDAQKAVIHEHDNAK